MKNERLLRIGATLSAVALFALPFVSLATELPYFLPTANFKNVVLTANSRLNAVTIGPGGASNQNQSEGVTLGWSAPNAKKCIGNWDENPLIAIEGTVSGTIPLKVGTTPVTSRTFTIVCFGIGTAKSAKVTVTIAKPDLFIAKLTITGLLRISLPNGPQGSFIPNTYKAGAAAYKLQGTVKNGGKLKADGVGVRFQYTKTPQEAASWATITSGPGEHTITTIAAGATSPLLEPVFSADPLSDQRFHFRVCADVTNAIVEMNENNNCSKSIGPFIFIDQP